MNWENPPVAESQVGPSSGPEKNTKDSSVSNPGASRHLIKVGRRLLQEAGAPDGEVYTLTLGDETIELLPFRSWGQMDYYKWGARGKLPGTPAGLEVTPDHVKMAGETVSLTDPAGCEKLEHAFNEWLSVESKALEQSRARLRPRPTSSAAAQDASHQPMRFKVELDKRGQVHISCVQGTDTLSSIGLSAQGLDGLVIQGLMRKPRSLQVGALHDWVELDGELCSFEHGKNEASKLETLLNQKYLPLTSAGHGKDILVFANAASPTGFDIQFPVTVGGVLENRRRTLNDAALELLQEPGRCGLLQPGLILKISPPTLIIKHKTIDGGEAYLESNPQHKVTLTSDEGRDRIIDLSHPVNYTRLGVLDLTALFNHPAINRHSKAASAQSAPAVPARSRPDAPDAPSHNPSPATPATTLPELASVAAPPIKRTHAPPASAEVPKAAIPQAEHVSAQPSISGAASPQPTTPTQDLAPGPNAWLKTVLEQVPIRFDWLTCLLYRQLAQHFGNSGEGKLGPVDCWTVGIGPTEEIGNSNFKGVFLTHKGGLGFLGGGRMLRFHRGVVFLGKPDAVLEGINVNLVGIGLGEDRIVFVVRDAYLSKFDVPEKVVRAELQHLSEAGVSLLSSQELLQTAKALEVLWTVPAEQANPVEPEVSEHCRPV